VEYKTGEKNMRDYFKTKLVSCANDAEHLELLHLLKANGFKYVSGDEIDDKNVPSTSAHEVKTGKPVHNPYAVHLDTKVIAFTSGFCLGHLEKQYGGVIQYQDFQNIFTEKCS
jgi:hypothetical protein